MPDSAPHATSSAACSRQSLVCAAILTLVVLLEGLYAVSLHRGFYELYGPFYDSMSYTDLMAATWTNARHAGIWPTLKDVWWNTIVPLPFLETALLAPFVPLTRELGIWLQILWVLALVLSVYYYFLRRRLAPWHAVCLSLPFIAYRTVFSWNAGLSDFRMDFSLYLFTSLTVVWYLLTYEGHSRLPWLMSGIFATLACLARATAPVYLAAMLAPLLAVRVLRPASRGPVAAGVLWMAAPVALVALPTFLIKWDAFHMYYFIRPGDANANLPLWSAARHIPMVVWNLGTASFLALAAASACQWLAAARRRAWSISALAGDIDWKLMWLAFAPAGLLALRGAGLNPFVSMPSIFGLILFLLAPFRGPATLTGVRGAAVCVLALAAAIYPAAIAHSLHRGPDVYAPQMTQIKQWIERMRTDAAGRGANLARFTGVFVGNGKTLSLSTLNVLIFDFGGSIRGGEIEIPGGFRFRAEINPFAAGTAWDWDHEIKGRNDEEKIQWLVDSARKSVDYVLLPDDASISFLERAMAHNFINTKVRRFKQVLLATGDWEPLGQPMAGGNNEVAELYRRRSAR